MHVGNISLILNFFLQEGSQFVTQTKELDSFNNDLRQTCRKVGSHCMIIESLIHIMFR